MMGYGELEGLVITFIILLSENRRNVQKFAKK